MANGNGHALVPIGEVERMATAMVKSKLFGVDNVEQAMALMLVAQAEGKHPMTAAQEYHIIKGRPSRKAESMLARFQEAGGSVRWTCYTDQRAAAIFSHPQGGEVEIDWTMERAKAAGLTGKDNWRAYPRQMLRARVITEGVRACYPSATGGMPSPEEIQDGHFGPDNAKDITPPAPNKPRLDALEEIIGPTDPKIGQESAESADAAHDNTEETPARPAASGTTTPAQAPSEVVTDGVGDFENQMKACTATDALKALYFSPEGKAWRDANPKTAQAAYNREWDRIKATPA